MTKHLRVSASIVIALLAWAIWTLAGLAATQVSTATGTWNIRHSGTSRSTILWHNGDDVVFHDGTTATTVQARGTLEAIGDNVFGLGSGAAAGRVIGLWRRGTDFAWVWTNDGTAPVQVTYTNPFTKTTGATSPATITGLVNHRAYYFVVTAVEGATESASSAEASATPVALQTLTVTRTGTGSGTVTSAPAGIACGADCTEPYGEGTSVVLNAVAAANSAFANWGGDADCVDGVVTMTAARICVATFTALAAPNRVARFAYVAHPSDDAIARFAVQADGRLRHTGYTFVGSFPIEVAAAPSGRFVYSVNHAGGSVSGYTIDPITGALTAIAGSPFGTLAGPWAIAIDPAERFAIVVDRDGNALTSFTVNPTTGALTTIGTVAAGVQPASIAIAPDGRFAYVANPDPTLNTVQAYAISATGALTAAGSAVATGMKPNSVTVNPAGTFLYVPNAMGGTVSIFSINATTGLLTPAGATPAVLGLGPRRLVFNESGSRAFLTNTGTNTVALYSVDAATGGLTVVSSMATGGTTPDALALDPTGRVVYAANSGSNELTRMAVDAAGSVLTLAGTIRTRGIPSSLALVSGASAVSYAPKFAYTANNASNNVSGFTINGTTGVLASVGPAVAAGFNPTFVTVDPTGRFAYVASSDSDTFTINTVATFSINATTGVLTKVGADVATGQYPRSVAVDPTGRFAYVANSASGTVTTFSLNATTGALTKVGTDTAAGNGPASVAVDPTGRFAYVANAGSSNNVTTFSINATTGVLTKVGADVATGVSPQSVAVDPTGRFAYVANATGNSVTTFSINATTGGLTKVGSDVATGVNPVSVAVDPTGRFAYVANVTGNSVTTFSINATTGGLTKVGADVPAGMFPYSAAVDPSGRFAYVANLGGSNYVITFSINATTGALTKVGGDVPTGLRPWSISVTGAIPQADLSLAKTDAPDPVASGQNLTYTLTVTNNGPQSADAVTLTDQLPPGTIFVSCTATAGTCGGPPAGVNGTVIASIGTLASGATATVTIVATATTAAASPLANTATLWSSLGDAAPANNSGTATTTVNARADLSLTKADAPDPVISGQTLAYTLVASNAGPDTATGVVVTDPLPAGTTFKSCTTDRGTCAGPAVDANGTVTVDLGALAPGATANISILVTVTNVPGSLVSNTAVIAGTTVDPVPGNNAPAAATAVAAPPALAINDVTVTEGNTGTSNATFTVTLAPASSSIVTVNFATANGTATAPGDYTAASGQLTFAALETTKTITVPVVGDGVFEPTEAFTVNLSSPVNATIADAQGVGTITNDDPSAAIPTVTITSPTSNATTTATSPFLTIGGTTVSADATVDGPPRAGAVTAMTWATNRGYSGTATGTTTWQCDVPLVAGANVITVTATDAAGQIGTDTLTVNVTNFIYYLAEGATGPFFDLELALANPTTAAAPVDILFLKGDGTTVPVSLSVPAQSRTSVLVDDLPGLAETAVSAIVTSINAIPLAVERTMRWDARGYGAHTEKATSGAHTTWLFAEGSEQAIFDTYLLLANPQPTANRATVTFLVENGTPVVKIYDLLPTSRTNVWAEAIPELKEKSFGMAVAFDQPGVAERAMYFGTGVFWDGGHESAGVNEAATSWFHAEGATGPFFDTFILLSNPNTAPATVTLTFLLDTGETVVKTKTVAANSRLTVIVEGEDPKLANAAMATQVTSTLPIVSERAMYWAQYPNWYEAHNSFGVTATGTRWALGEGRVGGTFGYETYILLANPGGTPASVTVTFLREGNMAPITKTYTVNATSRFNVYANAADIGLTSGERFGALIVSSVPIAVERAMYSNSPLQPGVVWAAGTNATGTRMP